MASRGTASAGWQADPGEDACLRVRVAERVAAGPERRPQLGAADLVSPLPADVDAISSPVGGVHDKRRPGDLRRGERAVQRGHGGLAAQPRVVPGQERGLPGVGDDEPLVDECQLLQLRGHRMGQPGEPEHGKLALASLVPFGDRRRRAPRCR